MTGTVPVPPGSGVGQRERLPGCWPSSSPTVLMNPDGTMAGAADLEAAALR